MSGVYRITDFGAVGDGLTLCTEACRAAARACAEAGGGILLVPGGNFVSGIFEIFEGTVLRVEKGGRLAGSPRIEDHEFGQCLGGLIFARDASGIRIEGEGVIDGSAARFFAPGQLHASRDFCVERTWQARRGLAFGSEDWRHGPRKPLDRPGNLLVFARCRGLAIEGLTITGAPYWTIHCSDCEDVAIR